MAFIRRVRTASGATAVQIAEYAAGRQRIVTHVGSAHTDAELGLLLERADRCADFTTKAVAAGLNERMVRLAERQGEMLAAIVTTALSEVALPADVAQALKTSIARQVRKLQGDQPSNK
ncbi:hypothetical protein [Geodermatophilus sp. URMC 63]